MLIVARSDSSEHITIWAGATAWEAALLGGARRRGSETRRSAPSSSLKSLSGPQILITLTDFGGGVQGGDRGAGARWFTLRELSGFEKINFSQKKFANSFFHFKGESATSK